jgi:carbonic anhydrase
MDTRLEPLRMLKASPGDLHIIRNAGGVVTADVVRSLVASTHSFGVTMVKLIMHTDCGMLGLDQGKLEADLGPIPFDMGGFTDLKEELRRGAERLQSEPLLNLSGGVVPYIYDVREATLRRQ